MRVEKSRQHLNHLFDQHCICSKIIIIQVRICIALNIAKTSKLSKPNCMAGRNYYSHCIEETIFSELIFLSAFCNV